MRGSEGRNVSGTAALAAWQTKSRRARASGMLAGETQRNQDRSEAKLVPVYLRSWRQLCSDGLCPSAGQSPATTRAIASSWDRRGNHGGYVSHRHKPCKIDGKFGIDRVNLALRMACLPLSWSVTAVFVISRFGDPLAYNYWKQRGRFNGRNTRSGAK